MFLALNSVPDNYASAKKAFLHLLKLHVTNNLKMLHDRPFHKELITTFVIGVFHLPGEILTLNK